MIAALFVQRGGAYFGLPGVDPWDEERDARLYDGPYPVVAHPPCSRWCRLAGLVEARWGHRRGDDGGCFAHALHCVRAFGGVLEHPAYSDAWRAHGLPAPTRGGWSRDIFGGWCCQVEQGWYGHRARKATWLYACGARVLPSLRWQRARGTAMVSWCRNRSDDARPRLQKKEASRTPQAFRDLLLSIAASAQREAA